MTLLQQEQSHSKLDLSAPNTGMIGGASHLCLPTKDNFQALPRLHISRAQQAFYQFDAAEKQPPSSRTSHWLWGPTKAQAGSRLSPTASNPTAENCGRPSSHSLAAPPRFHHTSPSSSTLWRLPTDSMLSTKECHNAAEFRCLPEPSPSLRKRSSHNSFMGMPTNWISGPLQPPQRPSCSKDPGSVPVAYSRAHPCWAAELRESQWDILIGLILFLLPLLVHGVNNRAEILPGLSQIGKVGVNTVYRWEERLLRFHLADVLAGKPNKILDFLACIPYLCHYFIPLGYPIFIVISRKPLRDIARFFWLIGVSCAILFGIWFCCPTAPPWALLRLADVCELQAAIGSHRFPSRISECLQSHPEWSIEEILAHKEGSAFRRLDGRLGHHFFFTLFSGNTVPFAAFPSGHVAWATSIFMIGGPGGRWFFCYLVWLAWATMYSYHHYFLDAVVAFAVVCCSHLSLANLSRSYGCKSHAPSRVSLFLRQNSNNFLELVYRSMVQYRRGSSIVVEENRQQPKNSAKDTSQQQPRPQAHKEDFWITQRTAFHTDPPVLGRDIIFGGEAAASEDFHVAATLDRSGFSSGTQLSLRCSTEALRDAQCCLGRSKLETRQRATKSPDFAGDALAFRRTTSSDDSPMILPLHSPANNGSTLCRPKGDIVAVASETKATPFPELEHLQLQQVSLQPAQQTVVVAM